MYTSFTQFSAEVKPILETLVRAGKITSGKISKTDHLDMPIYLKAYWAVYNNAKNADGQRLIAGVLDDLKDAHGVYDKTSVMRSGNILQVHGTTWSILLNDCWIMGGIHGGATFELASYAEQKNLFNLSHTDKDPDDYAFRVTGREILGLLHFGYSQSSCAPSSLSRSVGIKSLLRSTNPKKS